MIPLLLTAVICFTTGWLRGHFVGMKEAKHEAEQRHGFIASRQRGELLWHSRN